MSIESRSRQYGKVFGHWQIREFLGSGSGGKSAVFRLVHSNSSSVQSALKVISLIEKRGDFESLSESRKAEYESVKQRCKDCAEQEVLLMNGLQGRTNVVDYLDHTFIDWADESGFGCDMLIRMELLKDLHSEIEDDRVFSQDDILKIGRDICTALVLCHSKNILHRDVKPENIFFNDDGNYKLGDFGVSRILSAAPMSKASTGVCTPEYAAPEQMSGKYDTRVDIYSLGLVLYELSNGNRLPFATSSYITEIEVQERMLGKPLPALRNVNKDFAAVILKACAFNPKDRYQTAEDFLAELNYLAGVAPVTTTPKRVRQMASTTASSNYATIAASADSSSGGKYATIPASDSFSDGVSPNEEEAVKKYLRAAEQGDAGAQFNLGLCYENGKGVSKSWEEAVKWYINSAEQGNLDAQYKIGCCYRNGKGVAKSEEESVKWFRKAAEKGHADAQNNLGWCYQIGRGVPQNWEEAAKWYHKAAEQGNARAQCSLAWCYGAGKGVSQNWEEAVKWYRKSAEQGNATAQCNLAWCYRNGKGAPRNLEEAVRWYRKAAEQGDAAAQFNLGMCYGKGWGIPQSWEEAVKWYRKVAEQGYAVAQFELGMCYGKGWGIPQNWEEAVKWYRKAAEQGNAKAQFNLGLCYESGNGVLRDIIKAADYYLLAKKNGNAEADKCYRGLLENATSIEQRSLAKHGHKL